MPRRYFFHAPDGRIYGPAPIEALKRWRDAGRLRADSRLRAEGNSEGDVFLTFAEVEQREAALPPAPEPPAMPEPASASEAEPPPAPAAPPLRAPQPLYLLIADAWRAVRRGWRPLWTLLVLMQVPALALSASLQPYFHFAIDPKTGQASWIHTGALSLAMLGIAAWTFLGTAFLSLPLRDAREGRPVSPGRAWREFAPRLGGLLWTFFLAAAILAAWGGLTFLLLATMAALHGVLKWVVLVTAILSAVPTCLLALRCLILPQAAVLEGRRGLGALRRAIEVIRLSSRNSLFADGDLRLLILAFFCWLVLPLGLAVVLEALSSLRLPARLVAGLVGLASVFGWAALNLFVCSVFVHFYEDTRRRLRDAGADSS